MNQNLKSCRLPSHPLHGEYILHNKSSKLTYVVGHTAPPDGRLTLTCNEGYKSSRQVNTKFFCLNKSQWTPTLATCTSLQALHLSNTTIILIAVLAVCFVVALIAGLLYKFKFKKERKLRRELKLSGLNRFQEGNLKKFNPNLGLDDQAELLPYNNNYEFPRNKLKFDKQIGSGEFGIVIKADAFRIISHEEKTTVAVKTVKNISDNNQMKSLILELKIMVHLGQHLNVVNLLGACTQNIVKRELLVIVEYCSFGNLYNYLLRNRKNFINQIDSVTGSIDYTFGTENLADVLVVPNNASKSREGDLQHLNDNKSSVPNVNCNNSQSECNSNYCENNKESVKPLLTKDIITWSFQIARGMEYLASRKIIHGDLASRNILLSENNVVKISDFGLSKKMYRSTNFKIQKDCPLPIKWMAVESIRDRVFSTQSDVWSYGIVLWEIFSLAQTPYPGLEGTEKLYQKLMDGYKMASPQYAPKEIYKIMSDCWNLNPSLRPCFNKLAGTVGLILEENVRQQYIDLNDPYLIMNTQKLNNGEKDYLALLNSSADEPNRSLGYLCVKPTYITVIDESKNSGDSSLVQNV